MNTLIFGWSESMKGLMVTLLITLGAGIAQAQQYNESRFSDGTARSGATASDSAAQFSNRRSNSMRLSPLNPSARVNGPRVAQSSSRGDGFEVTSSQTFGGSRSTEDERRTQADVEDRSRSPVGGGQATSFPVSSNRQFSNDAGAVGGRGNTLPAGQDTRLNNQQTPPPFTLQVTDGIAEKLKENGYLRANVKENIQGSVDRIVMFADQANMNQVAVSGNVTDNDVRMVNDFVVIDVDDYTLRKIEKGTMNLKDLAGNRFQGVVLRYTGSSGRNIPIQSIPELSQRVSTSVADRGPFVANENTFDRNNLDRSNIDRNNYDRRDDRLDSTADRRPIASDNRGGSWQVNEDLRTPRGRGFANEDNYDRSRNQDVDRIRNQDTDRFAARDTQFENRDRTLGDRYLDEMAITSRVGNDTRTRDRDYVLDAIDRSRDRVDTDYSRGRVDQADRRNSDYDNSRSPRYQETLAEEARILRARLAAQERERELDREVRWVEEQKRLLAERSASAYPLTPPEYPGRLRYTEDRYSNDTNRQLRERLADRSTDPTYGGRPATLPSYISQQTNSVTDEVARMLKDKEDTISAKMAAMDHLMKMNAVEQKLDSKIEKIQDGNGSPLAGVNNLGGRVASYNDQGPVKGTMGGNMASSRGPQSGVRYASNAGYTSNVSGVRPGGGGIQLDVNSGGFGGGKNYSAEPTDGRVLRFMWLMLLLSLGANFYLAMLSRNFYTRYDELADELRETFSTTNNY